jgi:hypothetical protein
VGEDRTKKPVPRGYVLDTRPLALGQTRTGVKFEDSVKACKALLLNSVKNGRWAVVNVESKPPNFQVRCGATHPDGQSRLRPGRNQSHAAEGARVCRAHEATSEAERRGTGMNHPVVWSDWVESALMGCLRCVVPGGRTRCAVRPSTATCSQ